MNLPVNIKKAAVFFFYDKDGIVDDYINFLLSDIRKNVDYILVVCNGKLTSEGRKTFEALADNIFVRENIGFDAWAYKAGMDFIGWDNLIKFDELILLNHTIFGPIYPFSEMFAEMDTRVVDFWGITNFHEVPFDPFGKAPLGYIPKHIQSHWIAIRNSMLQSMEFKSYWDNLPEINSYEESVCFHESLFTKRFNDQGFSSDVYVNTEDLEEVTYCPLIFQAKRLVEKKRCPIIKRRNYFHEYYHLLQSTMGEPTLEVHNYIKKNNLYDERYIYQNILRSQNQSALKQLLHANYILNESYVYAEVVVQPKVALIMHIYFSDMIEYCFEYAQSMPSYADVFITVDTQEKKMSVEKIFSQLNCKKLEILIVENRGRDVSALLVACKSFINNYDLVCFMHDKKVQQLKPYSVGESFSYKCFESLLSTPSLVKNILHTFEQNPYLGMLVPPSPNHAAYYPTTGFEWTVNFGNCEKLLKKLKINVSISPDIAPTAPLGTMFWFRPIALKTLFDQDWQYTDLPAEPNEHDGTLLHAIERAYPLVVQHEGYNTAWVMSDKIGAIEITNMNTMLSDINKVLFHEIGIHYSTSHGVVQQLKNLATKLHNMNCVSNPGDIATYNDVLVHENTRVKVKNKLRPYFPSWLWNFIRDTKRKLF